MLRNLKLKIKTEIKTINSRHHCIDDGKLLEKYKLIWIKLEDLKNIEVNNLPVYHDRFIKTKFKTYSDKVYTKFYTKVHTKVYTKDVVECKFFTVISTDFLIAYKMNY